MRALLAAASIALAVPALVAEAQPPAAPPAPAEDPTMAVHRALGRGAYLEAVDRARVFAVRPDGTVDPEWRWFWLQFHPMIGGTFDPADFGPAMPAPPLDAGRVERARRAEVRDAVAEIVARARRTNVVILNEDHRYPRSRAFALEVARALRPLGYSIIAAEAFANYPPEIPRPPMADLARERFARLRTGTYLADPVFGDFVRQAMALGYRPVAYEQIGPPAAGSMLEQIRAREQAQAENLVAAIFRGDPHARVLIYVGHSHVAEAPLTTDGQPTQWMAARLKRITGIDPLTIDQTEADELDPFARAYRDLVAARMHGRPSILLLGGAPLVEGAYRGVVDLQVLHPPLRLVGGRPDWMRRIGRRPVAIPRRLLPARGRRLIQAFVAEEPEDAIPLDQIVVEAGRPPPPLMLPHRRVRWAFQDPVALAAPAAH